MSSLSTVTLHVDLTSSTFWMLGLDKHGRAIMEEELPCNWIKTEYQSGKNSNPGIDHVLHSSVHVWFSRPDILLHPALRTSALTVGSRERSRDTFNFQSSFG